MGETRSNENNQIEEQELKSKLKNQTNGNLSIDDKTKTIVHEFLNFKKEIRSSQTSFEKQKKFSLKSNSVASNWVNVKKNTNDKIEKDYSNIQSIVSKNNVNSMIKSMIRTKRSAYLNYQKKSLFFSKTDFKNCIECISKTKEILQMNPKNIRFRKKSNNP